MPLLLSFLHRYFGGRDQDPLRSLTQGLESSSLLPPPPTLESVRAGMGGKTRAERYGGTIVSATAACMFLLESHVSCTPHVDFFTAPEVSDKKNYFSNRAYWMLEVMCLPEIICRSMQNAITPELFASLLRGPRPGPPPKPHPGLGVFITPPCVPTWRWSKRRPNLAAVWTAVRAWDGRCRLCAAARASRMYNLAVDKCFQRPSSNVRCMLPET